MAEKKEEVASESAEASAGSGRRLPKLPLILGLVNTLLVLSVVGVLVYTRIIYKRPAITESGERDRIAAMSTSPAPPAATGLLTIEPFTVNIESSPSRPKPADGTSPQIQGKLHYVYIGLSIELRDAGRTGEVETLRPILLDGVLSLLGKKSFADLTTVQGRYVLRTQILELTNNLVSKNDSAIRAAAGQDPLFTNVYFTHFIVQ